jgi:glycosyltransferase involved in cell wall biosynthesis
MRVCTSVILPVRDGARFVGEAIVSALLQLDPTDEVIVVDDASRDQTRGIVTAIIDRRIELLTGAGRGVSSARNIGLAKATGEFVAFLDHDDMWPAARHRTMLTSLRQKPEIDAVFGRMRVRFEDRAPRNPRIAAMDNKHVGMVSVGTALFRRRIIDQINGFDEQMHFGEDVDFYNRLAEAGMRVELCETDALIYRRHDNNASNDLTRVEGGMADVLKRRIDRMRAARQKAKG